MAKNQTLFEKLFAPLFHTDITYNNQFLSFIGQQEPAVRLEYSNYLDFIRVNSERKLSYKEYDDMDMDIIAAALDLWADDATQMSLEDAASFYVDCELDYGMGYYDWGVYNRISNGGGQAGMWRTLKSGEWEYVFNRRTTSSGIRYAKGVVNGTNGIILLPDGWSPSVFVLRKENISDAPFSSNTISESEWIVLENAGAVFLPAAGYRISTSPTGVGTTGTYMSSSTGQHDCVLYSSFYDYGLSTINESYYYSSNGYGNYSFPENYIGRSVRLVCDVE